MRSLPVSAARGVGSAYHPGDSVMQHSEHRASDAVVSRGFTTAERLLLLAGLMSAIVVLFAALSGQ
jgi:hypothetical protein